MSWRLSKALITLKAEVDKAHPHRSKISDGTIGDTAHAARVSDHNPDSFGIVHAWDVTADPILHVAQRVVEFLTTGKRDPRLKYVIWQRRIYSSRLGIWKWRPYTGSNPHDHHAHISVTGDDGAPWGYGAPVKPSAWQAPPFPGAIRAGTYGDRVQQWAFILKGLGYRGFIVAGDSGKVYGAGKVRATKELQRRHGLTIDGVVGPLTWNAAIADVKAQRKAKGLTT